MKIKKLDELQYIKRGNIFKHCFFATVGLLMLYILMLEFNVVVISQRNALILIILAVVSLFCTEMICYDIYPLTEKRQKFLYFFVGLFGIVFIAISTYELITGNASFIENQIISDTGTGIIMGCLFFLIMLTYIIKSIFNKKKGGTL